MGGACSTYGGKERCRQGFWWINLRRKHLEDRSVDEENAKGNRLEGRGLDWFGSGWEQLPGFCEGGVKRLGTSHKVWGISWLAEELPAFSEGLYHMELVKILMTTSFYRTSNTVCVRNVFASIFVLWRRRSACVFLTFSVYMNNKFSSPLK